MLFWQGTEELKRPVGGWSKPACSVAQAGSSGLPRESGQLGPFLLNRISSPTWEPRSHTPWQL